MSGLFTPNLNYDMTSHDIINIDNVISSTGTITELYCTTLNATNIVVQNPPVPQAAVNFLGNLAGDVTGGQTTTLIGNGVITDAKISSTAAISNTKLATLTAAGLVANSATTAVDAATPTTIALRAADGSIKMATASVNYGISSLNKSGVTFYNSTNTRWSFGLVNTETGTNNTGADLQLTSYTDASASLSTVLTFARSTGNVTIPATLNTGTIVSTNISTSNLSATSTNIGVQSSMNMNGNSITNATSIAANNFTGNLTGNVTGNVSGNTTGSATNFTGSLAGSITGTQTATVIANNVIVDANISSSAAISNSKLATLTATGLVANSSTTATSANTASAIVARDASGNFSAGTVTASLIGGTISGTSLSISSTASGAIKLLSGSSSTSTSIEVGRTSSDSDIGIVGTAGQFFNDSQVANLIIRAANGIRLGTSSTASSIQITTGNTASTSTTSGTLTVTGGLGVAGDLYANNFYGNVPNASTNATPNNTPSTIVARDSSGNFSAGTITSTNHSITATTASSSTTTGALIVAGGVGVAGAVYASSFVGPLTGNATTATSSTSFTGSLSGNITGTQSATVIAAGVIVDSMISSSAAIGNSKLATLTSTGLVANSATTATALNTASAIIARDSSGNFSAGTITSTNHSITATTASTSTTTGALIVAGGAGIAGTVSANALNLNPCSGRGALLMESGSSSTAVSIKMGRTTAESEFGVASGTNILNDATAGDLCYYSAGSTRFGGSNGNTAVQISNNGTTSTSTTTGTLIVNGGVGVSGAVYATTFYGTVGNSSTTGTSANTANTLVLRDGSGNFSAGTVTLISETINTGSTTVRGALSLLTGSASYNASIQLGRSSYDLEIGSATTGTPNLIADSVAGDAVIRASSSSNAIRLGAGANSVYSSVVINTVNTANTVTGTGTLIVSGGASISGALSVGSTVTSRQNAINTGGSGTGALQMIAGGLSYPISISIGRSSIDANIGIAGATGDYNSDSVSGDLMLVTSSSSIRFNKGSSPNSALVIGSGNTASAVTVNGGFTSTPTTASTSTTTGALIVAGGVGVAGAVYASSFVGPLTGNATTATSSTSFTGSLSGNITGTQSATVIAAGVIVDSMISSSAAIGNSKLATLTSTGLVANSATTATALNTASAIIARDSSGNFSAGTITSTNHSITATTASSSTTTGALIVSGGVGVSGTLYTASEVITGNLSFPNYSNVLINGGNSTGYIYGAFAPLGDGIHIGYNFTYLNNSNTTTIPDTGAGTSRLSLQFGAITFCTGGVNTTPTAWWQLSSTGVLTTQNGGSIQSGALAATTINATSTTASTSTTTGALIVAGGVGVAGAVYASSFVGPLSGNATTATSSTSFTGSLSGNITGTQSATVIAAGVIVDSMISSSAAIGNSKLATLTSTGLVANSATTATALNTASAIIARDASGNFSAGTITSTNHSITATTASTSTTTGALIVSGGVGVSGNIYGSNSSFTSVAVNTNTSTTNGIALYSNSGSNYIGYALGRGGIESNWGVCANTGNYFTDTQVGDVILSGFNTSLRLGINAASSSLVIKTSGTASTNSTTGTLVVNGGIGVSGAIYAGTSINAKSFAAVASGSGTGMLSLLAGVASNPVSIQMGRTASDCDIGIAGSTGQYVGDALSGDFIIRSTSNYVRLNSGSGTSALVVGAGSTASTSTTTGAVTVYGGLGVSATLSANALNLNPCSGRGALLMESGSSTGAVSIKMGRTAVEAEFGVAIAGNILNDATAGDLCFYSAGSPRFSGSNGNTAVQINNSGTTSTSTTTGTLIVTGGVGVSGALYTSTTNVTSNTAASSSTTGALVVTGGIGAYNLATTSIGVTTGGNHQGAITLLTGNAANYASLQIGRATLDFEIGTAAGTGNFVSDSLTGDSIIRTNTSGNALRLAGGAGSTSSMVINTCGTASISTTTGAVVITGGLGISGAVFASTVSCNIAALYNPGLSNLSLLAGNCYNFNYYTTVSPGTTTSIYSIYSSNYYSLGGKLLLIVSNTGYQNATYEYLISGSSYTSTPTYTSSTLGSVGYTSANTVTLSFTAGSTSHINVNISGSASVYVNAQLTLINLLAASSVTISNP